MKRTIGGFIVGFVSLSGLLKVLSNYRHEMNLWKMTNIVLKGTTPKPDFGGRYLQVSILFAGILIISIVLVIFGIKSWIGHYKNDSNESDGK